MSDTAKFLLKIVGILLLVLLVFYLAADIFNFVNDKFGLNIGSDKVDVEIDPIENSLPITNNGSLTRDEIEQQKNDVDAPVCDDVFNDYYIYEVENYVFLSKKDIKDGKYIFPTISFVKTQNGTLQYDGTVGLTAKINVNWFTGVPDFSSLTFSYDYTQGLNYSSGLNVDWFTLAGGILTNWNSFHFFNNHISFTNFDTNFCTDFLNMNGLARTIRLASGAEANDTATLTNYTTKWINNNIMPYFTDLGDGVEFLWADKNLDEQERFTKSVCYLNSYATYMWNQTKTSDKKENQKVLDLSEYFAKFIYDENIYKQYPIPDSKKADYPNQEYFTVYNCKIMGNVSYLYASAKIDGTILDGDGDYVVIQPPLTIKKYSKVTFALNNKYSADLTNLSLTNHPVVIKITNDDGFTKTISFSDITQLRHGQKSIALEPGTYYYQITSDELVFDSYSGTFTVDDILQKITLDYNYINGYCLVSVTLSPISTVDMSNIDLSTYPVKIIYNSKDGGAPQQFIFNKNDDLTKTKSALMKIGEYEYSVLSEQLVFSSTSGNQSITSTNREFTFTYSVEVYQDDLKFTVTVNESAISSGNDLAISATSSTTSLLGTNIGQTGYSVKVKIFDKDGYIVKTCDHSHLGDSYGCADNWSSNGVLTVGETYTGQLLYLNTNDNSKSYVTGTFTFEYKTNTRFTFTYSCVEV